MQELAQVLLGFLLPFLIAGNALAQQKAERPVGEPGTLKSTKKEIEGANGVKVPIEVGTYLVPENRQKQTDKVIEIPFYRLKSTATKPAAPIFLLAGGPGASWIDRFQNSENFREVQFYQSIADVVLFDQRGCGHSRPKLECDQQRQFPLLQPLEPKAVTKMQREMATECRKKLIDSGIDIAAYNTIENAADVNDLRDALGYQKFTLIGGSYGSHLALTIMKQFPESVERAVLYGVEGLDQTWDDPVAYEATLQRIAEEAEASREFGPHIPKDGLLAALQVVIDRLENEPKQVTVRQGNRQTTVLVDAHLVRRLVGFQAGRKSRIDFWPELILGLYKEDYSTIAHGAIALRSLRLQRPVHYLMDCSSGISNSRRQRYEKEGNRALLGNLNIEYDGLTEVWSVPDLGPDFRNDFDCDVPTLIIHGTWDLSTPIENAKEVTSMLKQAKMVEVVTGSHGALYNLYEHWEPAHRKIGAFLRAQPVEFPARVQLDKVKFRPRRKQ